MSPTVARIAECIKGELENILISPEIVDVFPLDEKSETYIVTIISTAFEGQTYLDREMRVRPAVLRGLMTAGLARPSCSLELTTPSEDNELSEPQEIAPAIESTQVERQGRTQWREERRSTLNALEAARFQLNEVEHDCLYLAERQALSEERLLICFARSPRSTTVDVDLRRKMSAVRQSQSISQCYYLTLDSLDSPFSNQNPAEWLRVLTAEQFAHILLSSKQIADSVIREVDAAFERLPIHLQGEVIEPSAQNANEEIIPDFFTHVENWSQQPNASLLLLVADAGHGKTTITMELARRAAKQFLRENSGPVPVFVPFESVRRTVDFEALLLKRLDQLHGTAAGAYSSLLKNNRSVLFVDGFDELADDAGMQVAESQIRSMKGLIAGKAKVVLAGRSAFAEQFAGYQGIAERFRGLLGDVSVEVLHLQPFDDEQIARYLESRIELKSEALESVQEFVQKTADHEELASNPLFLRMLCSVAQEGQLKSISLTDGVGQLLQEICEREEERQQLGLGVAGQIEFLGLLADDVFSRDSSSLSTADVRIFAELVLNKETRARQPELIGRLCDHALIASSGIDRIGFIHPFIRDVLLATHVERRFTLDGSYRDLLGRKDLPQAAIEYLARPSGKITDVLPNGWLTESTKLNSMARRNLFRIAIEMPQHQSKDWPSRPDWVVNSTIEGLDCSMLAIEDISFRNMSFRNCRFEATSFESCDFDAPVFQSCKLIETVFSDCQFLGNARTLDSEVRSLAVRDSAGKISFLQQFPGANQSKATPEQRFELRDLNLARIVEDLLRQFLQVFMSDEFQFNRVSEVRLNLTLHAHHEQTVYDSVVKPLAVSKLCNKVLGAGSRAHIEIAKPWRNATVAFLRNPSAQTNRLRELIEKMGRKSARFFRS